MRRKTFDALLTTGGLVVAVVLAVAGALLGWGHTFAQDNVHNQLAKQQIFFPPASAFAHAKAGTEITPSMIPSVSQYAGQQLLTGDQAKVYADDFIGAHLAAMPYGGVYAKVSAAAMADPNNQALAAEKQTTFQGTTLRGMLLNAYAFSKMGEIAGVASLASYIGAGVMLLLSAFGLIHTVRTKPDAELIHWLTDKDAKEPVPAS
ncbi:MAG TPA: hypothetical protein VHB18_16530 [Mycobacteriales bacterium]|jgi:hypothetical protein|nr:hypothetical protein [Mycobacteriales bacterium]